MLRVDHLALENFRCFQVCEVALHPELTVFVADNGGGKTAILDALAIALSTFVDALVSKPLRGIDLSDMRSAADYSQGERAAITTRGLVAGSDMGWERVRTSTSSRGRTTVAGAKEVRAAAQSLREQLKARRSQITLPLVACYRTNRLGSGALPKHAPERSREAGLSRWRDASAAGADFQALYRQDLTDLARPPKREGFFRPIHRTTFGLGEAHRPESLLHAVGRAVDVVLAPTGWQRIGWDLERNQMVAEHPQHGQVPTRLLSDGLRTMTTLVGDLARRCVQLNPHMEGDAALRTPGVVLIDEVDLHLHPRWQQVILDLLRKAFRSLQFIVTTHSPQVISTVGRESVRVIRSDGTVTMPRFQTRGVESADILARVMDVDPLPDVPETRWLSDYRARVQSGRDESPEASELLQRLIAHFGEQHPVMEELATLKTLQEIKRARLGLRQGT